MRTNKGLADQVEKWLGVTPGNKISFRKGYFGFILAKKTG